VELAVSEKDQEDGCHGVEVTRGTGSLGVAGTFREVPPEKIANESRAANYDEFPDELVVIGGLDPCRPLRCGVGNQGYVVRLASLDLELLIVALEEQSSAISGDRKFFWTCEGDLTECWQTLGSVDDAFGSVELELLRSQGGKPDCSVEGGSAEHLTSLAKIRGTRGEKIDLALANRNTELATGAGIDGIAWVDSGAARRVCLAHAGAVGTDDDSKWP
jgi:hypothetical protein